MNALQLKQAVTDELEFEPELDAAHIAVFVHHGVVTLTGYVDDYAQKRAALNAVRRVKGVRAIAQELEVRLPSDKHVRDDEIAQRAVRILDWDLRLPPGSIEVSVENGVVQLGGRVRWAFQRDSAEADVAKLGGVVAVVNHITVGSQADGARTERDIRAALERAANLDSGCVSIALAANGTVVLTGHLRTLLERDTVEQAAWSASGVRHVENHITVGD